MLMLTAGEIWNQLDVIYQSIMHLKKALSLHWLQVLHLRLLKMINIIYWKVRGIRNRQTRRTRLKSHIDVYNVILVAISEPMIDVSHMGD